jgi:hypothetical protein
MCYGGQGVGGEQEDVLALRCERGLCLWRSIPIQETARSFLCTRLFQM